MTPPIDLVLARLAKVWPGTTGWHARCPVNPRHVLKLDVKPDGTVLLCCHAPDHAGCRTADVLRALGLRFSDLFAPRPRGRGRTGPAQGRDILLARAGVRAPPRR